MCRDSSIVVWLRDKEKNLVADAIVVSASRDTVRITTTRKGGKTIRKYVPLPKTSNYRTICFMVNRLSEGE